MCCCGKPNVNGEYGYRWNSEPVSVRPVDPPELAEGDTLLYDEPGRCGGIDSHCHHYRVVDKYSSLYLLVRHGGGDERIDLGLYKQQKDILKGMDSNARYWFLHAVFHAYSDGARDAAASTAQRYRRAFVEGRLKKRKVRGSADFRVWIEPKIVEAGE